ncbi:MAG: glycosyl hydrolase family 8 [Acetobacteraceae bacterium]
MTVRSALGYRALCICGFAVILSIVVAAVPSAKAAAPAEQSTITPAQRKDWIAFLRRYLGADGRIIDTANGGVSHTEGQGYGMLLATYFNDRPDFELMRSWTETTLRHGSDHLHAWLFKPYDAQQVADDNNATDGDIYIAWALLRAGRQWHDVRYTEAGKAIARDILNTCVVDFHGIKLLLPGAKGFDRDGGYVVNLSYYAFDALRALSRAVPDPAWAKLETDGLTLMGAARFGSWRLPPDWLLVTNDGGVRPADGWPNRFSWDAVRIPMHLAWVGLSAPPLTSAVNFWTSPTFPLHPPAWVELKTGIAAPYAGNAGIKAIERLAAARLAPAPAAAPPTVAEAPDYYAAALVLLSSVAASDRPEAPAEATAPQVVASASDPPLPAGPGVVSSLISQLLGSQ